MFNQRLLCLLLLLLLQACSDITTVVKKEPVDDLQLAWQSRKARLESIDAWALRGRLAVRTDKDAFSATLQWAQKKQLYIMRVIAPLGQGTYEIRRKLDGVSLLTSDNLLYEADDAETLMLANLGWSVPVEGMKYWIRGLPDPDVEIQDLQLDESALLTGLTQSGWNISMTSYTTYDEYYLPGRIKLENDIMKVTILAKEWLKVIPGK